MTGPQIFLMLFGALLTLIGVAVFFALTWYKRGQEGSSVIEALDKFKVQVPHALVIFVGGMAIMALPFFLPAISRPGQVLVPIAPTPEVTRAGMPATSVPSATKASSGNLQVRVAAIKKDAGGKISLLEKNPQLTRQDLYSLYVRPESQAYVYIFQYDCGDDETTVLFPNSKFSALKNPLQAGDAVWLPGEDVRLWFQLDTDAPTSQQYEGCASKEMEKIIVVASLEQDQEAEMTVQRVLNPAPTATPIPARRTPAPVSLGLLQRAPDVVFSGETDLTNSTVELPKDVKATLAQGSTRGDRLLYRLMLNP